MLVPNFHLLSRAALLAMAIGACFASTNTRAGQLYVGASIGGHVTPDVTVKSRSDDRSSVCDEYINPRALTVPGCTDPNRGAGDGWRAPFDGDTGISAELELGWRFSERWRVSGIYGYSSTGFDQTVSSTDATGVDFDKIGNELSVGEETLGTVSSHEFFIVGFRDWPNRTLFGTRWTPHIGAGVGVSQIRMDFSWLWARSMDPNDIEAGAGLPNVDEIRRNLAGTASVGRRTIRDVTFGYVLVAGAERALSDRLSLGVKAQWKRPGAFSVFRSGSYAGELLRSHSPNLRLDGSEPVSTWSRTKDTDRFSIMLTMRFAVP